MNTYPIVEIESDGSNGRVIGHVTAESAAGAERNFKAVRGSILGGPIRAVLGASVASPQEIREVDVMLAVDSALNIGVADDFIFHVPASWIRENMTTAARLGWDAGREYGKSIPD